MSPSPRGTITAVGGGGDIEHRSLADEVSRRYNPDMTGVLLGTVSVDRRRVVRWAIAIILAAAAARVGWAAWIAHAEPGAVRSPDTPGYLGPARALIDAGRFSLSPADPTPMFARTPGYPALLAPILWITDSEWAISPIQAAVSTLGVAVLVLVGRQVMGLTAGLVAGVLLVLDPLQFMASGTLLTEGVASLTILAITAAGVVVFATRRPRDVPLGALCALGILIALATMVRPTMWVYPVVLLPLIGARFRSLPVRAVLARLLVFLLPIVLVVGGWQLRNHAAVDSWQVSGGSGLLFICSNAAEVEALATGTSMDAARTKLGCPTSFPNPEGACTRTVGFGCWMPDPDANGQGFDQWNSRALDIMADHPLQTARMVAEGAFREVAGPGTDTVRQYFDIGASIPLTVGLFLWNTVLWGFAAVGAVTGLRSRYRGFWVFVIATIGYVLVISAGGGAGARYRTPIVPLVALLAALGIQYCVRKLRKLRSERSSTPSPRDERLPVTAGSAV
jgi:hypothetical protein